TVTAGAINASWRDPEGVVTQRRFFSRADLESGRVRFKPDSLIETAWGVGILYDPLEVIVR
ncbi:MAG: hydrolase, partial [Cypionkella sp.]|nr:hydrolase [Cypionkella sp.]